MNKYPGTRETMTVSGFFHQQQQAEAVLAACLQRGIPRDFVDLALSEQAASRFTALKPGKNTDNWFAWTGKGALAGLLISALFTLGIIMVKGYEISNQMAMVQLLGPDIGIMVGAILGALYGWLHESDTNRLMQRAVGRDDAMLLLVYMQPPEEASQLQKIFSQHGGLDIRIEPNLPGQTVTA